MNKIIVTGNLTKDMEVEITSNDKVHGKLSIAITKQGTRNNKFSGLPNNCNPLRKINKIIATPPNACCNIPDSILFRKASSVNGIFTNSITHVAIHSAIMHIPSIFFQFFRITFSPLIIITHSFMNCNFFLKKRALKALFCFPTIYGYFLHKSFLKLLLLLP